MPTDPTSRGDAFSPDAAFKELLRHVEADDAARLPLGYSLDQSVGMMSPGELALLWARSGTGKSTLLCNALSRTGSVPTVFFTMEMSAWKLNVWLTCMTHNLPAPVREVEDILRWGAEDPRYADLVAAFQSMSLYFPHLHFVQMRKPPTVNDLIAECDEIWDRTGTMPRRVFIDHLSLMEGARDYTGMSVTTAALKTWARNSDLGVIAIQQTGRSGGDQRNDGHIPCTLSSGIYAGEHDADFIFGLYQPAKDPKYRKPENQTMEYDRLKGVSRLQVIKNRPWGELNEDGIELEFDRRSYRLYERGQTFTFPVDPREEPTE